MVEFRWLFVEGFPNLGDIHVPGLAVPTWQRLQYKTQPFDEWQDVKAIPPEVKKKTPTNSSEESA